MKSLRSKFLYALTCASLLASLFITQPVHAASFIVSTPAQLIAAINAANVNNSNDVITLTANIPLTAIDNGNNGLPIILPDGGNSLTIEGGGFTLSRDGAAPNFRIIDVEAGANVTINDLTVTGGNTFFGAGINMRTGSHLILDHVEVSGNTSSGRAGGVYNYYATLTIQNGSVIGKSGAPNIGCGGGGIFAEGAGATSASTILDASTVSYNESPNCPGGGFYLLYTAQLIIRNGSVVSNNLGGDPGTYPPFTDPAGGGGIFASASPTITITDSTVSDNTVNCVGNPNCGGGGLQGASSVTITNSTFANNMVNCNTSTPCGGGGINNYASLTITNSTFSDNSTANDGGGIYNHNTLIITNSTFSGNSAGYGGGINNQSALTVTHSTLSGNSATNNGAGIYNINAVTIIDSVIRNNAAVLLGGGVLNDGGTASVIASTFSNNSSNSGGGIYSTFGTNTIENSTFSGNSATTGGSAITAGTVACAGGNFSINSTTIASGAGGSAAVLAEPIICVPAAITMSNTIVSRNSETQAFNIDVSAGFTDGGNNITNDATGTPAGITVNTTLGLGPLSNNGGTTQTHALLAGSPAIDAGNNTSCPGTDQRGVTRPINTTCDIGAYEYGASILTVTNTTPTSGATVQNLSSILVTFSENALSNGSANAANNTANYILVEDGADNAFDTVSCSGGLVADDTQQTISSISYNNASFTATLNLATPLTPGTYRLFICGTTSIFSAAGLELNNGLSDTIVNFAITASTPIPTPAPASASSLPDTGFAPSRITSLAPQPANLAYAKLSDIWLEIPSLNLRTNIVGVPKSSNGWNVDWLGNDIGWLNGTAFPSWEGNSVITGHVYNANGLPGPFANIKELKYGDQVIVHMYGQKYVFEIQETRTVRPFSTSYALKHLEDHAYLTLITCLGYNPLSDTYLFRRVIRAVLVDVQSE